MKVANRYYFQKNITIIFIIVNLIPKSFFSVISGDRIKIIRRVIYNITIISLRIYLKHVKPIYVVEGLSGSEKQPVVKFLKCALPSRPI